MWQTILKAIFLALASPAPVEKAPLPRPNIIEYQPPPPMPKSTPEKIYDLAKACLNKDIAATQNELGCAESVSYILTRVQVKNFPQKAILGTGEFYYWLKKNAEKVSMPMPGDIIISPTGTSTKGSAHGHIGIIAYHGILSNNSLNGLWQEFYTEETWRRYYGSKLGFPVFFYRIK